MFLFVFRFDSVVDRLDTDDKCSTKRFANMIASVRFCVKHLHLYKLMIVMTMIHFSHGNIYEDFCFCLCFRFYPQEISFDVFLQVIWEDKRIHHRNNTIEQKYIELKLEERHKLWVNFFGHY